MGPFARRAAVLAGALVTTSPGCSSRSAPPTEAPGTAPERAPVIARNPPAPQPRPTHDRVLARENGTCVVSYLADCPPQGPCDPGPDAERIRCPDNLKYEDAHLGPGRIIEKNPDGTCSADQESNCPPDTMCNPPPPSQLDCPERYATAGRDIKREGNHCVEYFSVDCPEGMSCNPPPPQRVPCPKGI